MNVSVEKLENSMAKLTIEIEPDKFEEAIVRAYNKQKGRINIPGFRKGKAPRNVIEKLYGPAVFYDEAANDIINSTYGDAADQSGEEITSNPSIDVVQIESGKPFIYTAEVALKPAVSLGKYKGVEVTKKEISVTDEQIDAEIGRERERNASYNDVTDRPVADGDMITLDFEGFVDSEAFEGGKGENHALTIGSGQFIPGFEEQLIGAPIGEEVEVNVTFPENYQAENLKGKAAVFKCTVKSIREKKLPELDDAFADEVSEFSTLAEYREDVKKRLMESAENAAKREKEDEAVKAVVADSKIDIPAPMLETQQRQMVDEFAQQFQMQGISMEQYMQWTGQTVESMMESMKDQADMRIRSRLCLEQIAKDENITVSDEEYEEELKKMAEQYRMQLDDVKKFVTGKAEEQMRKDLAVGKAATFVVDHAVEVEKKEEKKEEN